MSTTATYNGNIIVTISNETKRLTTKGMWLTDDITLTDDTIDGDALGYGSEQASILVGTGQVGYMLVGTGRASGLADTGMTEYMVIS